MHKDVTISEYQIAYSSPLRTPLRIDLYAFAVLLFWIMLAHALVVLWKLSRTTVNPRLRATAKFSFIPPLAGLLKYFNSCRISCISSENQIAEGKVYNVWADSHKKSCDMVVPYLIASNTIKWQ